MIQAGVTLALATDCNPGSSPSYNMQTVLGLAQSLYQITPEQALIAATHGSARALFYCFGENFVDQTYSAGKKVKGEKNPVSF